MLTITVGNFAVENPPWERTGHTPSPRSTQGGEQGRGADRGVREAGSLEPLPSLSVSIRLFGLLEITRSATVP